MEERCHETEYIIKKKKCHSQPRRRQKENKGPKTTWDWVCLLFASPFRNWQQPQFILNLVAGGSKTRIISNHNSLGSGSNCRNQFYWTDGASIFELLHWRKKKPRESGCFSHISDRSCASDEGDVWNGIPKHFCFHAQDTHAHRHGAEDGPCCSIRC